LGFSPSLAKRESYTSFASRRRWPESRRKNIKLEEENQKLREEVNDCRVINGTLKRSPGKNWDGQGGRDHLSIRYSLQGKESSK